MVRLNQGKFLKTDHLIRQGKCFKGKQQQKKRIWLFKEKILHGYKGGRLNRKITMGNLDTGFTVSRKIVLIAFQDEASRFGGPILPALKRLGAKEPLILSSHSSFALAGYAGSYMSSWISQAQAPSGKGPSIVTALIEPGNVSFCQVH